jgi:hypothetical protein
LLRFLRALAVVLLTFTVGGCAVIAGIFKSGFWVGAVAALIVVVLLLALFGKRA